MLYIRTIRLILIEMLGIKKIIIMTGSLIIYIMTRVLLYGKSMDLLYVCFVGPINIYIPDILSWIFFQITLSSLFGLFVFNHINIRLAYILQKVNNVRIWTISIICSSIILILFYYLEMFILTYIIRFFIYGSTVINDYVKFLNLLILNIVTSFLIIAVNFALSIINNNFRFNAVIILVIIFGSVIAGLTQGHLAKVMPICQLILLNKNHIQFKQALFVEIISVLIIWILVILYIKRNIFKLISRELRR